MIKRIDLLIIGINIITILLCLDYYIYTTLVNYLAILDFIFILLITNEYKNLDLNLLIYIGFTITVATLSCIYNSGGIGSILILINFILMMYLSTCIKLNNYSVRWISIMYIVLSYYWLIIGEISSYNPNTIGIIALLGVCFSFVFSSTLHSPYFKILITVTSILISFLLYKNISHSRTCFICGVLMLTFAWFIPSKIFSCKLIYWITGLLCTLGSLILTKVYIYLYNANIAINSAFSSKHFFSGRELIWIEVWKELDKHWFTGIGSQYNMTSLINGGFNVHNSILNFLAVYGLVVFILILGIMFYKFKDMYNKIYFKTKNLSYIGMCCIFILFIHAFAETTLISSMFYGPILTLFCLVNSEE